MDRFLIWFFSALVILAASLEARADPLVCPDPLVQHDDATEYVTHMGGQVYEIRWQAPDADPGELISCSFQIGLVVLLTIPSPAPLSCHAENVFVVTGRHVVDRWCTTATGDTDKPTTIAKFRVPGPKLFR